MLSRPGRWPQGMERAGEVQPPERSWLWAGGEPPPSPSWFGWQGKRALRGKRQQVWGGAEEGLRCGQSQAKALRTWHEPGREARDQAGGRGQKYPQELGPTRCGRGKPPVSPPSGSHVTLTAKEDEGDVPGLGSAAPLPACSRESGLQSRAGLSMLIPLGLRSLPRPHLPLGGRGPPLRPGPGCPPMALGPAAQVTG